MKQTSDERDSVIPDNDGPSGESQKPLTTPTIICSFVIVCLSCTIGCSSSEWIEVKCPGEHTATRIPRDPSSTYRHYGTRYDSGYRASETALHALIPGLPRNDSLRIVAADFQRYLTQERSAVQSQLEKTVARLQENPCDDDARKRFQYLIAYVNFNGNYLHKIAAACSDTSLDLRTMLEEYRREKN